MTLPHTISVDLTKTGITYQGKLNISVASDISTRKYEEIFIHWQDSNPLQKEVVLSSLGSAGSNLVFDVTSDGVTMDIEITHPSLPAIGVVYEYNFEDKIGFSKNQ